MKKLKPLKRVPSLEGPSNITQIKALGPQPDWSLRKDRNKYIKKKSIA